MWKKEDWCSLFCCCDSLINNLRHQQHIWFLQTRKPMLKKLKELFLANAQRLTEKENE